MKKTNAARILDRSKIKYSIIEYEVDENDLSALSVGIKLGQEVDRIFKTLVLLGDKTGIIVACVPGDGELDLKSLAKLSGNKKVNMINMKDLQRTTGYIRGGCSPLGMKKIYPTYIDESALKFETIYVSAGTRGQQLEIAPGDLIKAADIKTGGITAW